MSSAKFVLGLFLCLLVLDPATAIFDWLKDLFARFDDELEAFFTGTKNFAVCSGKVVGCGFTSAIEDTENQCESVRKAGRCLFHECSVLSDSGEGTETVLGIINKYAGQISDCAPFTAAELNSGGQLVPGLVCMISCLVLGFIVLKRSF